MLTIQGRPDRRTPFCDGTTRRDFLKIGTLGLAGDVEVIDRPVTFPELFATLCHNLGIDASATTITDFRGRPQCLVDDGAQPLDELVST